MTQKRRSWITISPDFDSGGKRDRMLEAVRALSRVPGFDDISARLSAVEQFRKQHIENYRQLPARSRAFLMVLADLVDQGWSCRVQSNLMQIARPADEEPDRDRIRLQLHVQRNRYLQRSPVQDFITSMERRRLFRGQWTSIFSLMRNGAELSSSLRAVETSGDTKALCQVIRPYIQIVVPSATCEHTGLELADIWRYFRLTWANRYQSIPGRSLMLLMRDAAAPHHPVIGIAALGSSAVQIGIRDEWIGWTPDKCVSDLRESASDEDVEWLIGLVENGLRELFLDDIFDRAISPLGHADIHKPTDGALKWLLRYASAEREKHSRLVDPDSDHKRLGSKVSPEQRWKTLAETPLFKSKRAALLAMLLRAKVALVNQQGTVSGLEFRRRMESPELRQAVQSLIRRAKAERVGVAVADITICGAIAPYSHLLGGKLVAMLAASPEVVEAYRERYKSAKSIIASSLAGRPIVREPSLVFLGTTSLYGSEPTQYTRLHMPSEEVGGLPGDVVRYRLLGHTLGFGTFQFSDETVDALQTALSQSKQGQRVNSIFGEGASPRLRKIRDGLDLLNLPSDLLLRHGASRLVYGVALIRNLKRYLLGQDVKPEYLFPMEDPAESTQRISEWWATRWLAKRVQHPGILEKVAGERLTYPIRHGARVPVPEEALLPFDSPAILTD